MKILYIIKSCDSYYDTRVSFQKNTWLNKINNESDYMNTFIQAGKENKLKFKQKLNSFKNTSQQARLTKPLEKIFKLF